MRAAARALRGIEGVSRVLFLLFSFLLVWEGQAAAADYYSFSPDYYLNGTSDHLYTSDKTNANGTRNDVGVFTQKSTLGLSGPVIGPYLGLFNLQSRWTTSDVNASDHEASVSAWGVGGTAQLLPTSRYPFSVYFDLNREASDASGVKARTNTTSYGLSVNPRLFRGTTLLTYDHNDAQGSVEKGTSFSDTRDRGNLFYRDGWTFGGQSRLDYEYQFTLLKENHESGDLARNSTESEQRVLVTHYTKPGENTQWLNSLAADYALRDDSAATGSPTSGSVRYESAFSYDYTRDIRGLVKLDHLTVKTLGDQPVSNTDALSLAGTYERIPNPVPKLSLNLQASAAWEHEWESGRGGPAASVTAISRWSGVRFFDVLNDLGYSYSGIVGSASILAAGGGEEPADALAYRFGLQGGRSWLTWHGDYTFQKTGLVTDPASGGIQHVVSLGEQASLGNFHNQSFYTFTRTETGADDSRSLTHLLWLLSTYRLGADLNVQAQAIGQDTTVLSKGAETRSITANVALSVGWNPFPRILLNAAGDANYTTSTGGDSMGYRAEAGVNWLLRFVNLRLLYRYEQQEQRASAGAFKTAEHRVELQATTSFSFRLGSFAPRRAY